MSDRFPRSGRRTSPLIGVAAGLMLAAAPPALAESLPVFRLAPASVDTARSSALFNSAFGIAGEPAIRGAAPGAVQGAVEGAMGRTPRITDSAIRGAVRDLDAKAPQVADQAFAWSLRRGAQLVEVDRRSGFVFLADFDRLWNPMLKPDLPREDDVKKIADEFVVRNGLAVSDKFSSFRFSHFSETASGRDLPGGIDKVVLDRQANYRTVVEFDGRSFPVVGGGGEIKVSIGDGGRVVGAMGGWRPIADVIEKAEIIPAEQAIASLRKTYADAKISDLKAEIAYYSAPAFESQAVLAPVWVVRGMVEIDGRPSPMRIQIVPATAQFGPNFEAQPKLEPRKAAPAVAPKRDLRRLRINGDDETRGASLLDLFVSPAYAQSSTKECGTSWIGDSGGLPQSAANRRGFTDQCRAAGWSVNFDWGDAAAWETDWRRDDDLYVDAADLVFYTGHANPWSWDLRAPQDGALSNTEVGGAQDLYGDLDLEWLIIAACGPHQSNHFTTAIDNAFDRWRAIFDGLHVFAGYGAVTFDNSSEGRRVMELARAGWSLVDAWFRTAQEIQPGTNGFDPPNGDTVFVTAMWAHNGDHCARNEKIHGFGPTCPDVRGAGQQRHLMWSGT